MKKKLFGILFLVLIAIFAFWYFYEDLFRFEVLDKISPISEENDEEKWNFINATKESTCLIYSASDYELFESELNEDARQIYLDHGINAYDLEYMDELMGKYKDDEDLNLAISDAILNCVCDEGELYDLEMEACVLEDKKVESI